MNEQTKIVSSPQCGEENIDSFIKLLNDLKKHRVDIEKALSYGGNSHSFDHIVGQVLQGRLHFYPLPNSFIIMEVINSPNFSVYHAFLAGGNLEEITDFQETLVKNAKQLECKALSMSGRRGWEKALKPLGWQHKLSHLVLELDENE